MSLGKQPCADTFLKSKRLSIKLKRFPLVVGFCKCSHMSAIYPITGFLRYENMIILILLIILLFQEHILKNIASQICKKFKINKKKFCN